MGSLGLSARDAVFELVQVLEAGSVHTLYRATDRRDGSRVILKCLDTNHSEGEARRLRHEFAILRDLRIPGVVEAKELRDDAGELCLVLADFAGETLAALLARSGRLTISRGLGLAIGLAEIVGQLHAQRVIHKDLKPRNILIDSDDHLQLIDFGAAAQVTREEPSLRPLTALDGTLAYISPEQSGRTRQSLDHRSDLYSLGVTLYELFVGHTPFSAEDPAALIHAHIARIPRPPHSLRPELPVVLSQVILRLLEKAPERRYRSAFGLAHDLRRIRDLLGDPATPSDGNPLEFALGERDPPLLFQIPDRLFGREAELAAIDAAIARIRSGGTELVLLRGPAGAGKSQLLRDLRRPPRGQELLFAAGRCDPIGREIPYTALQQALGGLLRQLLDDGPEAAARWRWTLKRALGATAATLATILPELRALLEIENEPPTTGDTAEATRNRLNRGIFRLIRALATPENPLLLTLEDLQAIDPASLEVVLAALAEAGGEGFGCIATYRAEDPALPTLEAALAKLPGWCQITTIEVGPLATPAIAAMIAETLDVPPTQALPLAEIIAAKTQGSALFAAELFSALHRAGIVAFRSDEAAWSFDLAAAAALPLADNVAELLIARIHELPPPTIDALEEAACIGDSFTASELADPSAATTALTAAALAGVIEGTAEGYRFAHERVREALYEAMDPEARRRRHLALGRRWRHDHGDDPSTTEDRRLFAIVEHYGRAREPAAAPELVASELRELAHLAAEATRRARRTAAFTATMDYAAIARRCLGEAGWRTDYALALEVTYLSYEAALGAGELAAAEAAAHTLEARANSPEDRARASLCRASIALARNQLDAVLAATATAAHLIGERIPVKTTMPRMILAVIQGQRHLGRRGPEDLLALPAIRDPRAQLLFEAFRIAHSAAFQGDVNLVTVLAVRQITLALRYGVSARTAPAFVVFGIAIGAARRDYAVMDAYGRAGRELLRRFPDPTLETLVAFLYGGMIQPMVHPFPESISDLRAALRLGIDAGANQMAAYCWVAILGHSVVSGVNLEEIARESALALPFLNGAKVGSIAYNSRLDRGFALALRGESEGAGELSYAGFDEAEIELKLGDEVAPMTRYVWLHNSLIVNLILGRLDVALARIAAADPGVEAAFRLFYGFFYYRAFRAVALAAASDLTDPPLGLQPAALRRQLRQTLRQLATPAASCPANFAALRELVAAELAQLSGDARAPEAFEQAITQAQAHDNTHVLALACERAGRYYRRRGLEDAAHAYLHRARRAYHRWGAKAKVAGLDREFPGLARSGRTAASTNLSLTLSGASISSAISSRSTSSEHLVDLASVIKAAQAFAAEIDLQTLAGKLLRIVVENAGAERGVLLLAEEGGLFAVADFDLERDTVTTLEPIPLDSADDLHAPLIHRALAEGRALAIDETAEAAAPGGIRNQRSLLAAPLIVQSRTVGLLYLENNLAAGIFTPQRLEVLQLLAIQAAITVEHASFFRRIDRAREAAEAANLAKSRFLANMSHELRTPLNAILGYAELVAEEAADAGFTALHRDLGKIQEAGRHLLSLIGEILDLTKVESGTLEIKREVVVIAALLDEVVALAEPEVTASGNRLRCPPTGDLGILIGDPLHLRQVLLNLLSNAAKFTHDGEITLRAHRDGELLCFEVADTGIGIPEAQLATIFDPFTQVDPSSTRRYGGVGLGLTICRRLCEQMGGTLEVTSLVGEGSIFRVSVPRRSATLGASEGYSTTSSR